MKFVTREYARVDRIACPWLILRFIDSKAGFLFVPRDEVLHVAEENDAIPFDIAGAELNHFKEGGEERCSFDAILRKYDLRDAALLDLAEIIRGADCELANPRPESAGLKAVAAGFRTIAKDDYDNMRLQFPLYDALYRYCQNRMK
jgi:hypothetical protein